MSSQLVDTTERTPEGTVLRVLRAAKDLSQEQLAERAELCVVTVARIEAGHNLPSRATALKLATALDLPVEVLFPPKCEELAQ
jgi:transcriptional regulator with XRE-family HTH domain